MASASLLLVFSPGRILQVAYGDLKGYSFEEAAAKIQSVTHCFLSVWNFHVHGIPPADLQKAVKALRFDFALAARFPK